ncbi:MAG: hypothetical protein K0S24_4990 [Sphingobacterium sp.]|jgi:hypothetical protein|nr:hypothetical protein [Sphingobacterium sp.]
MIFNSAYISVGYWEHVFTQIVLIKKLFFFCINRKEVYICSVFR